MPSCKKIVKQDPTYLEYVPRLSVMGCLIKKEKAFSIGG